jgi:hypothetical protein
MAQLNRFVLGFHYFMAHLGGELSRKNQAVPQRRGGRREKSLEKTFSAFSASLRQLKVLLRTIALFLVQFR